MKIALVGQPNDSLAELVGRHELEVIKDPQAADLIVTYGGDGSLIGAERNWPGIPKLGIRDNANTIKCSDHRDDVVFEKLVDGDLDRQELIQLTASIGDRKLLGVNDVILRNSDIRSSVRFVVSVNGEELGDETIGDGLVIATPFGSSAYFRSITKTSLRCGIGLAFNNCTEFVNHVVLREDDQVSIRIVRGPAEICADNDPEVVNLKTGDAISVRRSGRRAIIFGVDALRCGRCRYAHAPRRRF